MLRCTLGTAVRVLNWTLAASAGFSALCLAAGISRSALVCRMLEVRLRSLGRLHTQHDLPSMTHLLFCAAPNSLVVKEAMTVCYLRPAVCTYLWMDPVIVHS